MVKLSIVLGILGAALLLFSFAPAPALPATNVYDVAYGKALFAAKGCAQCHYNAAVPGSGKFSGAGPSSPPDLTNRPLDPAYLRRWLKDPSAVKPNTAMPTLGLSDDEIEALVTFLNTPAPRKG